MLVVMVVGYETLWLYSVAVLMADVGDYTLGRRRAHGIGGAGRVIIARRREAILGWQRRRAFQQLVGV